MNYCKGAQNNLGLILEVWVGSKCKWKITVATVIMAEATLRNIATRLKTHRRYKTSHFKYSPHGKVYKKSGEPIKVTRIISRENKDNKR